MGLKYLGTDPRTDWIPGVPARDLTDDDLAELELGEERVAELASSRLYERIAAQKAAEKAKASKGDN